MTVRVSVVGVSPTPASTLSTAEQERAAAFHRESDRSAYICAHALLRRELSQLVPDVRPEDWEFDSSSPGQVPGHKVWWSLSHTRGQVAVAVSAHSACGIDTEAGEVKGWHDWGDAVLSATERHWLMSLPTGMRAARFRWLWTAKEALAKATRRGLGKWLTAITIDFGAPITVLTQDGPLPLTVSTATTAIPTTVVALGVDQIIHWSSMSVSQVY